MDNVKWTSDRDLEIGDWWAAFRHDDTVSLIHSPCLGPNGTASIGTLTSTTGICRECNEAIDEDVRCLIILQRIGLERKVGNEEG